MRKVSTAVQPLALTWSFYSMTSTCLHMGLADIYSVHVLKKNEEKGKRRRRRKLTCVHTLSLTVSVYLGKRERERERDIRMSAAVGDLL